MTSKKIYQKWLDSKNISNETKEMMKKLNSVEIEKLFVDTKFKFGTSGVRAKMGPGTTQLNEITYIQLSIGLAKWIINKYCKDKKSNKITWIIGHDNRLNSDKYSVMIAKVLKSFGINVLLFKNNKLIPTPIVSYVIKKMNADGGTIVTASHNPKTDNGFKVYQKTGGQILPNQAEQLVEFIPSWEEALDFNFKKHTNIDEIDDLVIEAYFEEIRKWLSINNKILYKKPIIFSAMHGTASYLMKYFLSSLGFNVIELEEQCFPDSDFRNTLCVNPEEPESFNLAIEKANKHKSKLIFACDPDADRLGVAIKHNGKWEFLNGNQTGIIQSWYLLGKFKDKKLTPVIISTFVSTNYIDRMVKNKNGLVMRTPTGFKWIANQTQKFDDNLFYINGFEEAIGGLPTTIVADKDSFQVASLILKILNDFCKKDYDLIDILECEIYPKYGHWFGKTISTIIPGQNWETKAKELLAKLKNYDSIKVGDRVITSIYFNEQGQCLDWTLENDSWIKFRLSGTEPKFKTYFNLYPKNDKFDINKKYSKILKNEVEFLMKLIRNYLGL